MSNDTYTLEQETLSAEDKIAIDHAQDAYAAQSTEIGAQMEATESLTPAEQREESLKDLQGLLFMVGVQEQMRWLPDRIRNAKPHPGEKETPFANRVNRMQWQKDILDKANALIRAIGHDPQKVDLKALGLRK